MSDWQYRATRYPTRAILVAVLLLALVGLTLLGEAELAGAAPPKAGKADVFPADNVWNRVVTDLPVHPLSSTYLSTIGLGAHFHADFGSGTWDGRPIGIPYVIVPGTQPKVPIHFTAYGDESDPGPMPIPANAPIEGGPDSDGDRHVLVIDEDNALLYELYRAFPNPDGSWDADSAATWPLNSNATRPDGWTSADAAGLPIFAGLARYDEVASGAIHHALRFTVPRTQKAHIWPARHDAGSSTNSALPPMGLRLRLKADVDLSRYRPQARIVLQALKDYGMILTDNGSAVYLSGAPDERWDNDDLHSMDSVTASMLEVVDESGAMADPNTAQAKQPGTPTLPPPVPGWSAWATQGGVLADAPAAAAFGGRLYAFAVGVDPQDPAIHPLYAKSSADGLAWSAWASLGGNLTDAPAAAAFGGRLYAFAKGVDPQDPAIHPLYAKSSADGATWTAWQSLGGNLTAAPAAAAFNGRLYAFAKGVDPQRPATFPLYAKSSADGAAFGDWQSLGGNLTAAPAAAAFGGRLYVFAAGTSGGLRPLYVKSSPDGATFTDWANLGGDLTAAPAAAAYTPPGGAATLAVLARGSDGALYLQATADGAAYSGWTSLGGQLVGAPAAAGFGTRLYALARGSDDALWARHTLP